MFKTFGNIDNGLVNKAYLIQKEFQLSDVLLMPDAHNSEGIPVGFVAKIDNKLSPEWIGPDIGCGLTTVAFHPGNHFKMDNKFFEILFEKLKNIKSNIPEKDKTYNFSDGFFDFVKRTNIEPSLNYDKIEHSFLSIGGGNHFIEIGEDKEGFLYITIHSGSRNFGMQIYKHFNKYIKNGNSKKDDIHKFIEYIKLIKSGKELENIIKEFTSAIKDDKHYLYKKSDIDNYMAMMNEAIRFAKFNRLKIAKFIAMEFEKYFKKEILGLSIIETIHNYIDDNMILRKGAIESPKDKLLILPGNMKDGIWLVKGKGNSKWLNSAPHGMGRVMSRTESKKTLSLSEFEKQMDDIQTFNDLVDIIDDAPNSYKNPTEVLDASKDTISIVNQIKPLFNYKEKFKNESED